MASKPLPTHVFLLFGIYICASAFLVNRFALRLVLADLIMICFVALTLIRLGLTKPITIAPAYKSIIPMLFLFLIGGIFARFPERVALEWGIIVFGLIGSLTLFNIFLKGGFKNFERLCQIYVLAIGIVSLLNLMDFVIWPTLLESNALGGLSGSFRNTGQAGSFFSIHVAICVALLLSKIVPRKTIFLAATVLAAIALACTLKRSASLGFLVGMILIVIRMILANSNEERKLGFRFIGIGIIFSTFLSFGFIWALENIPGMAWRVQYKFSTDAFQNVASGFLTENLHATAAALSDRPLFGVGLENVRLVYFTNEIHSTYLGLIAYGGVVGFSAYIFFLINLLLVIWNGSRLKLQNQFSAFLFYFLPLFLGLIVSWGYTYHLRKREFWILMAFVVACNHFSKVVTKHRLQPKEPQ